MTDLADLLARAEAALADVPADSGTSAVVAGIACVSYPIGQPWATQAKAMGPPSASALDQAVEWLDAHAPARGLWTVTTRTRYAGRPEFTGRGFRPWLELPVLVLGSVARLAAAAPVAGLTVGAPDSAEEFLGVYGPELAPLVTPGVLASPTYHLLVGRVDGVAVACAQVREVAGTAYVSAVGVLPEWRDRGIGSAISAAAARYALGLQPRAVWLSAESHRHRMYGRIGFRPVDTHVLLRPEP
ncbi:Acetyltransferase (GNAT) family protein [Actinopolymorpha cephalotaxi]|uniref:Acetyltransferase (GNAT) family protein n=1 Tax=Actinopolymorpha cephalotaxi TaxID=504797 RepID=A0A1I2ZEU6_9ACTN|nr:GNAT family N-acetyltransferase [Actinopolymorpha cephalotaxi]NYH81944.1 GNAT superfamily N-acetyltransferase [Actinopolymorpha cephalotaxi]SFH36254.1 Acetyltransferase (GNAT) family protein [Actinopolymorpha cephalotaxi]